MTAELLPLIHFDEANGANPNGSLILDASGNLFGTTQFGGDFNYGTSLLHKSEDAGFSAASRSHQAGWM